MENYIFLRTISIRLPNIYIKIDVLATKCLKKWNKSSKMCKISGKLYYEH